MFINGMAASAEELEGLLTADVRRVNILNFPLILVTRESREPSIL